MTGDERLLRGLPDKPGRASLQYKFEYQKAQENERFEQKCDLGPMLLKLTRPHCCVLIVLTACIPLDNGAPSAVCPGESFH
jgi:hypothetical protein